MVLVKPISKPSPLKQESGSMYKADQTTFRTNFHPHDVKQCFRKSIPPPEPALINISSEISPVNVSETYKTATQTSFRNPKSAQITIPLMEQERSTFDKKRIYNTNFKMSVDNHFNGFSTTNSIAYPPTQRGQNLAASASLSKPNDLSVLKLSDPSLLGTKISYRTKPEYLDSFREFTKNEDGQQKHVSVAGNQHYLDHLTVPLTDKTERFVTTAMDTYRGAKSDKTELPLSARLQQKRITSIPFGDKDQVNITSTVCQDTYRAGNQSVRSSYDKENAHSVIHQSSIKLGDTQLINEVKSSILPTYVNQERQKPILYERNASSLPTGDLNRERVKERLSSVTMFPKPPQGSFPYHVDSSNLHTLSCVHLGHEKHHSVGQTTMKKSYNPSSSTMKVEHVKAPPKDNIPFDYYNDLPNSTVQDSFRRIDQSKVVRPNKVALKNLSKSHWEFPCMEKFVYRTTHQNDFFLPPVV